MSTVDWNAYYDLTENEPVHPVFDVASKSMPASGVALDLGCGAGRTTLALLARGFRVVSVDAEPEAIERTRARLAPGAACELVCAPIQEFEIPTHDVCAAMFTLFFLPREAMEAVWSRIRAAMRPGGVFCGQFLGVDDAWAERGYTVDTLDQVRARLEGFELLHLEEVNRMGKTADGNPKHWHVFHVAVRKP